MLPAPDACVTRRLIHLVHGLSPCAGSVGRRQGAPFPAIAPLVLDDLLWLVRPVLTPVFHHHRIADFSVGLHDAHLEDVYETDEARFVPIDVYLLRAPGLIRRARL